MPRTKTPRRRKSIRRATKNGRTKKSIAQELFREQPEISADDAIKALRKRGVKFGTNPRGEVHGLRHVWKKEGGMKTVTTKTTRRKGKVEEITEKVEENPCSQEVLELRIENLERDNQKLKAAVMALAGQSSTLATLLTAE